MAIAMAGAFISFLVDYAGIQYLKRHRNRRGSPLPEESGTMRPATHDKMNAATIAHIENVENSQLLLMRERAEDERLSVMIMEGGIIFHSIRESFLCDQLVQAAGLTKPSGGRFIGSEPGSRASCTVCSGSYSSNV